VSSGLPYDVYAIQAFADALKRAAKQLDIAIGTCSKQQPDRLEFMGKAANQYGAALTDQITRLKNLKIELDANATTFQDAVPVAEQANQAYRAALIAAKKINPFENTFFKD